MTLSPFPPDPERQPRAGTPADVSLPAGDPALGDELLSGDALSALDSAFTHTFDAALGAVTRDDAEASWRRIAPRLQMSVPIPAVTHPRRRWMAWTAGAVGVAGMVALLVFSLRTMDMWPGAAVPTQTVATGKGERARIELGDGSIVQLSAQSTLRYSAGFNGRGNRTVQLDGEAFFEVIHTARTPFVVQTATTATQVLGTAFGVRQYVQDSATLVLVTEGKVSVSALTGNDNAHIITQGHALQMGAASARVAEADMRALAWRQGHIEFDDTPLPVVLAELERWYDVKFVVSDARVRGRHINATFSTQSLETVMRVLSLLLNAPVERTASTITIG